MTQEGQLRCSCGAVQGTVTDAAPRTVTRAVCYCDDCQAFAHYLKRPDLLDAHGGTDVVQVAPAALRFDRGVDRIVCVRLTAKGLYRFYASCCNTPLGNCVSPSIPFVGIVAQAFEVGGRGADDVFGKPIGAVSGKFAIGTPPAGWEKPSPRLLLRAIWKVLGWRMGGKAWPHPFFDRATRAPVPPVTVLSQAERDALRPLCGPRPSASGSEAS